jgi:hypothetical protein
VLFSALSLKKKKKIIGTKMPSQRAKFKVTENERVKYN